MGGDDLSADEYQSESDHDEEKDPPEANLDAVAGGIKKRKGEDTTSKSTNKKKSRTEIVNVSNPSGRQKLMLRAARGIGQESPKAQAAFLWTCYSHALLGTSSDLGPKFEPNHFVYWWNSLKKNHKELTNDVRDTLLPSIIKQAVCSTKQLKKWSVLKSPMVLVLCVSARRCVALLKALASLKVHCLKLFAKHLNVDEQLHLLRTQACGIAVGTPNRILKLCEEEDGLCLDSTQAVVLDGHENDKGFTVCTLPDTIPDLANFISSHVQPKLQTATKNSFKLVLT